MRRTPGRELNRDHDEGDEACGLPPALASLTLLGSELGGNACGQ
ncbi:hypothetical protein PJI17_17825 [Mycobacterium kansasii]